MSWLITKSMTKQSEAVAKHLFKLNAYARYGLYHDDLIGGYVNSNNPQVAEAYRRLAIDKPEEHDKRIFRSLRANQLKIRKDYLPEEEWTTFEEDQTKGRYLQPYLQQIAAEEREKREFMLLDG